ncbi:MAG: type I DNA topoisomerase [Dehalococcoidia bacterium]|nr:type I DNA topoisomerase [Dehalococcoidia bacterium]
MPKKKLEAKPVKESATKSSKRRGKEAPRRSQSQKLVIVESPAKARTLNKILGRGYAVKASMGHVRDLPRSALGVDIENDFAPKYVIPKEKKKIVKEIQEASSRASSIFLATDPDREGEAISWHLTHAAKMDAASTPIYRVAFHEITEEAVKEAFEDPHSINMNLVNAQQARRILDRLVGYKISPLLWRKVQKGLSAGRVQSVAVKIVVEREREIQNFTSQEYWSIEAELARTGERASSFRSRLVRSIDGSKPDIQDAETANGIIADLENAGYTVKSIQNKKVTRRPSPPFITSTLQQEAWRKLHFTAKHTMAVAQQLYEGLPVGQEGSVGLITYMRTDSTHVASSALNEVRDFIREKHGKNFLPPKPRAFSRKTKWAQEAHEAIRPTKVYRQPEQIRQFLNQDQMKVYELIWKRMVASQMAAAIYNSTTAEIAARVNSKGSYLLRASNSIISFPGFIAVYSEGRDEERQEESSTPLPELHVGEKLVLLKLLPEQHFTQPPLRYTEATLIKALEEKGIGRPSTYAPTISTIQGREYVHKMDGKFHPDELGIIVNDILDEHFPRIVDYKFTARMESHLDEVARGENDYIAILKRFYHPFEDTLNKAFTNVKKIDMTKPTDEICPNCGRPMVIKVGRFGKFLACSGYPECKTAMPYVIKVGAFCPDCGSELVEKKSKKRRKVFYGCSNFPQCKFATNYKPVPQPCPHCGKLLVQQGKDQARCTSCGYRVKLSQLEGEKQKLEVSS